MKVLMAVTLLVVADTSSAGPNLFQFDRASGTSMLLTDNLSADWFEAVGPLDRCRGGGRTTNGDQTILGNTRRSIINVCTRANPGDEKCICIRRNPEQMEYALECGICLDPCAMRFVPMATNDPETVRTFEERKDFKKILLEEFFRKVVEDFDKDSEGEGDAEAEAEAEEGGRRGDRK